MTLSNDVSSEADAPEEADPSFLPNPDGTMFAGDTGKVAVETRRVLVQLLLGPSVDAKRQTKLWPVLLRDESAIRSRLHELFLDVVIDHEQKVAFTRQVVSDQLNVPILLRKASLTFIETALLLYLRQRLTQADAQDERAVVSLQEMTEHLAVFERERNADPARFERQTTNAVEKAKKLNLIQRIRGGEERYEVAPTLKLLFSADEIQILSQTYAALATAAGDAESPAATEIADATDSPGLVDEERDDLP